MRSVLDGSVLPIRFFLRASCAALIVLMHLCVGCGPAGAEFDRVPAPISFAQIRETARWCPSFSPAWWGDIDASYTVYDGEVHELILREWDAFARLATQERGQSKQADVSAARALLARMRGLEEKSLGLELAFVDRCRAVLPPASQEFLDLFVARRRFERAGATWASPDQALPGVLELLALDGAAIASEALVRSATDAYQRSAEVLERERRRRFNAYLEFIEANANALEAQRTAKSTFGDQSEEVKVTEGMFGPLRATMESAYRASDDAVGRVLASELIAILPLIEDGERRECLEDRRLEYFFFSGISAPRARGKFAIWRALADLEKDPQVRTVRLAKLKEWESGYDEEWTAIKQFLRENGNAPNAAILGRVKNLKRDFEGHVPSTSPINSDAMERLAHLVASRSMRASDAAAELLGQVEGAPGAPESSSNDSLMESRDSGMRLFVGWPLHPSLTESIAGELQLDAQQSARVDEIRREETVRLAKETELLLDRIKDLSDDLEAEDGRSIEVRVRTVMQVVRAQLQRTHEIDLEANARFFARVVEAFAVQEEASRLRVSHLRADLACRIGVGTGEESSESLGGLTEAAIVDLTRLPQAAGLNDVETEAFLELVLGHSTELTDAAQAAHERMVMNVGRLLRLVALKGEVAEYWETLEAGALAVDLRLGILSEARRVLGADAGDRLDAAFRYRAAPGLETDRALEMEALRECAENPASDARLAANAAVATAEADSRFTRALREAMRWRAHTVLSDPPHASAQWDAISRAAPLGALFRMRARDADERAFAAVEASIDPEQIPLWLEQAIRAAPPRRVRAFGTPSP